LNLIVIPTNYSAFLVSGLFLLNPYTFYFSFTTGAKLYLSFIFVNYFVRATRVFLYVVFSNIMVYEYNKNLLRKVQKRCVFSHSNAAKC
jgi:hypothetical protein